MRVKMQDAQKQFIYNLVKYTAKYFLRIKGKYTK